MKLRDVDAAKAEAIKLAGAILRDSVHSQFTLADHVEVKGARFENGLLVIDLQREVPETMKPRRIQLNSAGPSNVTQIESKAA